MSAFSVIPDFGQNLKPSDTAVGGGFVGIKGVTQEVFDAAVEDTLRGLDEPTRKALKEMWARDNKMGPGEVLVRDAIDMRARQQYGVIGKTEVVIGESLTAEESKIATEYAPDCTLKFVNSRSNEHGLFAARRVIDTALAKANLPPGVRYLDIGGNVLYHVRAQDVNCVTVAPFSVDAKDAARKTTTLLALRRMAADASQPGLVRSMAESVLRGDERYHVPVLAQACNVRADYSIAVHVYDIELEDMVDLMERCGVMLHEGCVHFSSDFFEKDFGTIDSTGAAFEIDHARDVIRMRPGQSGAMWYEHKFSKFVRFGCNQIVRTATATYSYRIRERRQDTIFYSILRVGNGAVPNEKQVYALPDVKQAVVSGFELFPDARTSSRSGGGGLTPRVYRFPLLIWELMYSEAVQRHENGSLTYEVMASYYRRVVPKQSYNTVPVFGGSRVGMDEIPALIIMSAAMAIMNASLVRRATGARVSSILQGRARASESLTTKAFATFCATFSAAKSTLSTPLTAVMQRLAGAHVASMPAAMVQWEPTFEIRSVNLAHLVRPGVLSYEPAVDTYQSVMGPVTDDVPGMLLERAKRDEPLRREIMVLAEECGDSGVAKRLERVMGQVGSVAPTGTTPTAVGTDVGGTGTRMRGNIRVDVQRQPVQSAADRCHAGRAAIREAIDEVRAESEALVDTCRRVYADVCPTGEPSVAVMRERAEACFNPDVWHVVEGTLVKSELGGTVESFSYGGVFVPFPTDGVNLVPVLEVENVVRDEVTGEQRTVVCSVMPYAYTGKVLVLDGLKIFNGPAIVESLREAMMAADDRFAFEVVAHQGPPGCGKTTTVIGSGDPAVQSFLAPTRMAVGGLKEKAAAVHPSVPARQLAANIRTLHSFLVNYKRLPERAKRYAVLNIDEYVLARSGQWIAAAVLMGARVVHAYGDDKQITHKPRAEVPVLYLTLPASVVETEYVTHRNCAVIVAGYNIWYGNKIRTTSTHEGFAVRVRSFDEVVWDGKVRLLSMYQADKKYLGTVAKQYSGDIVVSTVHEAQGTDCDTVVLFNGDVRKRDRSVDARYLYFQPEYCLVAMSRARKAFYYVQLGDTRDLVNDMIDRAADVRRVLAAAEVATQGVDNLGAMLE